MTKITAEDVVQILDQKAADTQAAIQRMDSGTTDNGVMRVLRLESLEEAEEAAALVRSLEAIRVNVEQQMYDNESCPICMADAIVDEDAEGGDAFQITHHAGCPVAACDKLMEGGSK